MNNEEKIISMLEIMGASIAKLEGRFDGLEGRFDGLESKVDVVAGDIKVLKTDVAVLKVDMEGVKSDIVGMKSDIEELKENSEITRYATNKLLDWAERVENHTITITHNMPPLNLVE
ncbi:MAG: hypothetical protein FWC76_06455 [Defluviitaleaceae bacterium]|nr:hypothetical protein [Defluviitaleaceae bacterium]